MARRVSRRPPRGLRAAGAGRLLAEGACAVVARQQPPGAQLRGGRSVRYARRGRRAAAAGRRRKSRAARPAHLEASDRLRARGRARDRVRKGGLGAGRTSGDEEQSTDRGSASDRQNGFGVQERAAKRAPRHTPGPTPPGTHARRTCPNCDRSPAYAAAASRQNAAPPTLHAPMLTRPPSKACIAILKPDPAAPTLFSDGTKTLSRLTAVVGCMRQPIFFSGAPKVRPGAPCIARRPAQRGGWGERGDQGLWGEPAGRGVAAAARSPSRSLLQTHKQALLLWTHAVWNLSPHRHRQDARPAA